MLASSSHLQSVVEACEGAQAILGWGRRGAIEPGLKMSLPCCFLCPLLEGRSPRCLVEGASTAQAPRCSHVDLGETTDQANHIRVSLRSCTQAPPLQLQGWSSLDAAPATPLILPLPLAPGRSRPLIFNRLGGAYTREGRVFKSFLLPGSKMVLMTTLRQQREAAVLPSLKMAAPIKMTGVCRAGRGSTKV